ncbi:MAG: class I SAM-dependent rRNA methyltransferase [Myxococcales bacterium FL481]|nr:MAG: class I SAM-dependent rRNA methyltransferase [Myxococcales bacterium FL481]
MRSDAAISSQDHDCRDPREISLSRRRRACQRPGRGRVSSAGRVGYAPRPMTRKPASPRSGPSRANRRDAGPNPGEKQPRQRGTNRAETPAPRPRVRSGAIKVAEPVARVLRAGHPWVFRDALPRELQRAKAGTLVPVLDPSGHPLGFGLIDDEGAVAVRMVSLRSSFELTADVVRERVMKAKAYREAAVEPENLAACRVVHGEADGLPGVGVDRLGEYLLLYKYSRCADAFIDDLVRALEEAYTPRGIYLQERLRSVTADERRPGAQLLSGRVAESDIEVQEDGLRFLVDVTAPVSPGLFLDLREGRRLAERLAPKKRVLNLFSFTGAFALRAVRAQAAEVCNVDAAARSHARCRQNLTASGLDPEACEALTGDCFKFLERMRQRDREFDLVIVDPPPFSNVKGAVFSALRDWNRLMEAICPVVARGGHVLAICNAARLSDEEFHLALGEGCYAGGRRATLVGQSGLPADFPVLPAFTEGRYLKIRLVHLA